MLQMRHLKILRLIGSFGPDIPKGPAKVAYGLTKATATLGVKTSVYTAESSVSSPGHGFKIKVFRPNIVFGHYRLNSKMLREALREDADIVHVHGYRNFESDVGAIFSQLRGRPLVITSHGTVTASFQHTWSTQSRIPDILYDFFTARFDLRKASRIVASSEFERAELRNFGVPDSKIVVIPHGLELPPRKMTTKPDDGLIRLLVVSRLTHKNNLELAIRAFEIAHRSNPRLRLTIVGGASQSKFSSEEAGYAGGLRGLCHSLGIEEFTSFAGWRTGEELWTTYEEADIFIWPSSYDNFGHALVEAAKFGLPIVSTDVGVARIIISREHQDLLIWDRSPERMAQAILSLASNVQLRASVGEGNKARSAQFSVERMTASYLGLYEELLHSDGHP